MFKFEYFVRSDLQASICKVRVELLDYNAVTSKNSGSQPVLRNTFPGGTLKYACSVMQNNFNGDLTG
jgi:hypothetical protein